MLREGGKEPAKEEKKASVGVDGEGKRMSFTSLLKQRCKARHLPC